jgi:hypothetical protein
VFTARYALSPYIKQMGFVFKGLIFNSIDARTSNVSSQLGGECNHPPNILWHFVPFLGESVTPPSLSPSSAITITDMKLQWLYFFYQQFVLISINLPFKINYLIVLKPIYIIWKLFKQQHHTHTHTTWPPKLRTNENSLQRRIPHHPSERLGSATHHRLLHTWITRGVGVPGCKSVA